MRIYLFQVSLLILLFACNSYQKNIFVIHGETDRVGDAILLKIDPNNNQIDTTSIKKGKFKFEKNITEEELFRIKFHDGSSFDLLVKSGEKIIINFQKNNLSIKGSSGSQEIMKLDNKRFELMALQDSITKELQRSSKEQNY